MGLKIKAMHYEGISQIATNYPCRLRLENNGIEVKSVNQVFVFPIDTINSISVLDESNFMLKYHNNAVGSKNKNAKYLVIELNNAKIISFWCVGFGITGLIALQRNFIALKNGLPAQTKKSGCLMTILTSLIILLVLSTAIGIAVSISISIKNGVQETQETNIIENAEQFSRISLEELKSIMGEPVLSESWVNTTSKGNFDTVIYEFDKNSNHYEFIVANDTVAKMRIYSSKCWTNTGDYFTIESSKKNIYESFGITLDKNYTTKDTGATYTMESLNNKIARMRVHGIENNTYQLIDFFYDMQYFD